MIKPTEEAKPGFSLHAAAVSYLKEGVAMLLELLRKVLGLSDPGPVAAARTLTGRLAQAPCLGRKTVSPPSVPADVCARMAKGAISLCEILRMSLVVRVRGAGLSERTAARLRSAPRFAKSELAPAWHQCSGFTSGGPRLREVFKTLRLETCWTPLLRNPIHRTVFTLKSRCHRSWRYGNTADQGNVVKAMPLSFPEVGVLKTPPN